MDVVGIQAGGRSSTEFMADEEITFGGILDPVTGDWRMSHRIQAQPDADDLQMGHAMRAAKHRDIEAITRISVNTSCSILHFY